MSIFLFLVPRGGPSPINPERIAEETRRELKGKILNNLIVPLRFLTTETGGEPCIECFVGSASCLALMIGPKKRAAISTLLSAVTRVLLRDYAEVEIVYCPDDGTSDLPLNLAVTDVDQVWSSFNLKEYHRTLVRRYK